MSPALAVLAGWLLVSGPAAAQAPPAAPADAPAPAPAPPAMVPLGKDDASTILGRQVVDGQNNAAGRITDVLVDGTGVVRAAVVDFGGFLGVGQRRIAVGWGALRFDPATRSIRLMLGAPELASAPEYKPGGATNLVATPARDIPRPSEKPAPNVSASGQPAAAQPATSPGQPAPSQPAPAEAPAR